MRYSDIVHVLICVVLHDVFRLTFLACKKLFFQISCKHNLVPPHISFDISLMLDLQEFNCYLQYSTHYELSIVK